MAGNIEELRPEKGERSGLNEHCEVVGVNRADLCRSGIGSLPGRLEAARAV